MKPVEIFIVVISIQVETLKELVIPKPIPLVLPKNRLSVEVTLIYSITHAYEDFRNLNIILKDTPLTKRP